MTGIQVQQTLKTLGYWSGKIDGNLRDPVFRGALKKYQTDTGLVADGWYGANTDAKLTLIAGALANATPEMLTGMRRFRLTWYYIADEDIYTGVKDTPVYDNDRKEIARVSSRFFADLSLEGTGRLTNGKLLNVTGKYVPVDGADYAAVFNIAKKNGWIPDKSGYAGISLDQSKKIVDAALAFQSIPTDKRGLGYGVQKGLPLTPFRTLATDIGAYKTSDPRYYKKGGLVPPKSRVWIANFVGQKLPDGSIHDGWCVAGDTGGAIYGAHFDVFTGTKGLKQHFTIPPVGYIWYETPGGETSAKRIPYDYSYGL